MTTRWGQRVRPFRPVSVAAIRRSFADYFFFVVFVSSVVKNPSMRQILFVFVVCSFLISSGSARTAADPMNAIAERYAHLVLALGQHDPDYDDAFYGPAEWKTQGEKEKKSPDAIGAGAAELSATLTKIPDSATEVLGNFFLLLFQFLISPWRLRCARSPIYRRAF